MSFCEVFCSVSSRRYLHSSAMIQRFFQKFRSKRSSLKRETAPKKTSFFSARDFASLDLNNIPPHVAIMMDGNRRWSKVRNLCPLMGHHEGARTLTQIVRAATELGIRTLTVYAFSTENWNRPSGEVDGLMDLLMNT